MTTATSTAAPSECRICHCTDDERCRLEAGEECCWLTARKDCCSNPQCVIAYERGQKRVARARYEAAKTDAGVQARARRAAQRRGRRR